uniref:Uncharacterized protein n=1 Tax=Sphaerodactylus townsendi TaxID=933632 RepID=A0ACB8ERA5_9SAUR
MPAEPRPQDAPYLASVWLGPDTSGHAAAVAAAVEWCLWGRGDEAGPEEMLPWWPDPQAAATTHCCLPGTTLGSAYLMLEPGPGLGRRLESGGGGGHRRPMAVFSSTPMKDPAVGVSAAGSTRVGSLDMRQGPPPEMEATREDG